MPLFVKLPGQDEGRVDDREAATVDILPTVVDVMDVEVDWSFDGRSLLGSPERDGDVELFPADRDPRTDGFEAVVRAAERNHEEYLPYSDGWLGVAQVGALGARVGEAAIDEGPAVGLRWELDNENALVLDDQTQRAEGQPIRRPVMLTGTVESSGPPIPDELLVGLNGRIAGVATVTGDGEVRSFTVLVAEQFFVQGENEVELLAADDASARSPLRLLRQG